MSEQPIVYRSYGEEQEIEALKQKIEELKKGRRPKLPREVADALEKAKKDHGRNDLDYIAWRIAQSPDLDDYAYDSEPMKVLRQWANENSLFDLIDALRYGYTIAPPKVWTVNRELNESDIGLIRSCYRIAGDEAKSAISKILEIVGAIELIEDLREGGADE